MSSRRAHPAPDQHDVDALGFFIFMLNREEVGEGLVPRLIELGWIAPGTQGELPYVLTAEGAQYLRKR